MKKEIYITIDQIEQFGGCTRFRSGDKLSLEKDKENAYDDEAISVFDKYELLCGYVANSVSSVARGTYSAGRIYDQIKTTIQCEVCFVLENCLIAKLMV
ncbi:MAG: hypothetical protein IJ875_02125 [Solobacterium sp.]|nr:hypothetical protein [Solobacterium sp.]